LLSLKTGDSTQHCTGRRGEIALAAAPQTSEQTRQSAARAAPTPQTTHREPTRDNERLRRRQSEHDMYRALSAARQLTEHTECRQRLRRRKRDRGRASTSAAAPQTTEQTPQGAVNSSAGGRANLKECRQQLHKRQCDRLRASEAAPPADDRVHTASHRKSSAVDDRANSEERMQRICAQTSERPYACQSICSSAADDRENMYTRNSVQAAVQQTAKQLQLSQSI